MATITEFLDEQCDVTPSAEVHKGNLFRAYVDWALGKSLDPLSRRIFDKVLSIEEPQITVGVGAKSDVFRGVRIRRPIKFVADTSSPWDGI